MIPDSLKTELEAQAGARVGVVVPRAGGGASRQGAEIELIHPDGASRKAYLSFDSRLADPYRHECFRREAAILEALSGPLAGSGVTAPPFIAAVPSRLALATGLVPGTDKFSDAEDPAGVARDFMGQLARLHRIDATSLNLDGFGAPEARTSVRIRATLRKLREQNLKTVPDPILLLALNWLEENLPDDRGPEVLLHGDAGPGNFLHQDGRVTAMLDWELTHFGDPMEDIAQIWVRCLFQPFRPMSELIAAYEAAGGLPVDIRRVKYHRLFFQMSFTVGAHATMNTDTGVDVAMLGLSRMFYQAHMRVIVLSLGELMGIDLPDLALPDVPAGHVDRSFETALSDLAQEIVPRLPDQHSAVKAKSLARLIKWWRARDRYGAAFERAECDELEAATGISVNTSAEARAVLARCVLDGDIDPGTALWLCHGRAARDTALMADAMGRFATTYFPSLDGVYP